MNNPVFDALFKKVENEPYARKLGMELVKLDYDSQQQRVPS